MNSSTVYLTPPSDPSAWQQALYAFLAEKHRRSGSMRTVQSYSRMLQDFFGRAHRTPDQVTSPDVLSWAHGRGLSDREPGSITIGARIACVSSFYKFLIRMGTLASNPCDALERPKIQPSPARGYTADDVRKVLAVVPDTVPGRRDRAIILTLVLTGRRRSEVINLKAGNITTEGDRAFYTYRGKGGKTGRRELPQPAYQAMVVHPRRRREDARDDGSRGVALAGGRLGERRGERDLLLPVPQVPGRGWPPTVGRPHPPPHGRQAAPGGRGVDRVGQPVPRPLVAGRDDGLPATAGGADGRSLGEGGRGDWGARPFRATRLR